MIDEFPIEEVKPVNIEEVIDDANDESHLVDEAAVPNVVAEEANLDQLRE